MPVVQELGSTTVGGFVRFFRSSSVGDSSTPVSSREQAHQLHQVLHSADITRQCLNALHDRAFDSGLMWIEADFVIRMSPKLSDRKTRSSEMAAWLSGYNGKRLILSSKFQPDPGLLMKHAMRAASL